VKLPIRFLEISQLFELLIELVVEGVQDSGLESQSRTTHSEDTDGQHAIDYRHCLLLLSTFINDSNQSNGRINMRYVTVNF
jgi:hypothetical protein